MNVTEKAILDTMSREAMTIATEIADKTDYEAAGYMLRISRMIPFISGDRGLVRVIGCLIAEATDGSDFTYCKNLLRNFKETFDYGVQSIERIVA